MGKGGAGTSLGTQLGQQVGLGNSFVNPALTGQQPQGSMGGMPQSGNSGVPSSLGGKGGMQQPMGQQGSQNPMQQPAFAQPYVNGMLGGAQQAMQGMLGGGAPTPMQQSAMQGMLGGGMSGMPLGGMGTPPTGPVDRGGLGGMSGAQVTTNQDMMGRQRTSGNPLNSTPGGMMGGIGQQLQQAQQMLGGGAMGGMQQPGNPGFPDPRVQSRYPGQQLQQTQQMLGSSMQRPMGGFDQPQVQQRDPNSTQPSSQQLQQMQQFGQQRQAIDQQRQAFLQSNPAYQEMQTLQRSFVPGQQPTQDQISQMDALGQQIQQAPEMQGFEKQFQQMQQQYLPKQQLDQYPGQQLQQAQQMLSGGMQPPGQMSNMNSSSPGMGGGFAGLGSAMNSAPRQMPQGGFGGMQGMGNMGGMRNMMGGMGGMGGMMGRMGRMGGMPAGNPGFNPGLAEPGMGGPISAEKFGPKIGGPVFNMDGGIPSSPNPTMMKKGGLAGAAQNMAGRGRDGDSMLVHMSPGEVKGLQALAMAHGGSLSINPDTGLVEASFLKKLLPMIAGAALMATGVGAPLAAGMVGGFETLRTGDIGKGLMAGLGAYGGAGLAGGLSSAGAGALGDTAAGTAFDASVANQGLSGAEAAMDFSNPLAEQAATTARAGVSTTPNLANMGEGVSQLGSSAGRSAVYNALPQYTLPAAGASLLNAATPEPEVPGEKELDEKYKNSPYRYNLSPNFSGASPTRPNPYYTPAGLGYAAGGDIMMADGGSYDDEPMGDDNYAAGGGLKMKTMSPGEGTYHDTDEDTVSLGAYDAAVKRMEKQYGAANLKSSAMPKGNIAKLGQIKPMASGGLGSYSDGGRMLRGPGDGMSDSIPGVIGNKQPARLADGEFVVPADVVSHLGNGSTDAGAKKLYSMMDKVRSARTGNKKQGKQIKPEKYMPA